MNSLPSPLTIFGVCVIVGGVLWVLVTIADAFGWLDGEDET